jgi:hypothetical protein
MVEGSFLFGYTFCAIYIGLDDGDGFVGLGGGGREGVWVVDADANGDVNGGLRKQDGDGDGFVSPVFLGKEEVGE